MAKERMYPGAKTWNPFKGCRFGCVYCVPTFQAMSKWQKCPACKAYEPHEHPERLGKIPSAEIVFVCGSGDISFCRPEYVLQILASVRDHWLRHMPRTYYLQSKRPEVFGPVIEAELLVPGIALVTTLETNRDEGHGSISKAPPPQERFRQFAALEWPRKVITIEPVMDFDPLPFVGMIRALEPEYVWLGYNSKPGAVRLPEPPQAKVEALMAALYEADIEVRGKDLRGIECPGPRVLAAAPEKRPLTTQPSLF